MEAAKQKATRAEKSNDYQPAGPELSASGGITYVSWFAKNAKDPTTVATKDISDLDFILISRSGLTNRSTGALAERLALTAKETAQLLTLSLRTYHRKSPDEVLNPVASERLLLLTKLADHGVAVFEDQGKFNRWLRRPLRILGGNAPLAMLDTGQGIKWVDTLLGRMEHGVYS